MSIDIDLNVLRPSGKHTVKKDDDDIKVLVKLCGLCGERTCLEQLCSFSMAGNFTDSSYEVGVEVSQQHGSGILDCHLDNDRTFLCMQQSSEILYYIYEEWFRDSKSVFTAKLCEAETEDVLRYVRDMIFAMVRRKLRWHNDSCLIERRNCSTLKEKLAKDIHDIFSLGKGGI